MVAVGLVGVGYLLPRLEIVAQLDPQVIEPVTRDTPPLTQGGQLAAVIIDGFIAAKPQSGLERSPLVSEFPAEAAIPRYLAFMRVDTDTADEMPIGPVRSLRPYFFDTARAFGALVVHVGGSPAALELVRSDAVTTLNEFFLRQYFFRSPRRSAPHNVYTTTLRLQQADEQGRGVGIAHEPNWIWLAENVPVGDNNNEASKISIDHFEPAYSVQWLFASSTNQYRRQQGGKDHVMENGSKIQVSDVIVLWTDVKILDSVGRREIKTIGEGDMKLFRNGLVFKGRWQRKDGAPFQFFDTTGQALELAPGNVWVHVLPVGYHVSMAE